MRDETNRKDKILYKEDKEMDSLSQTLPISLTKKIIIDKEKVIECINEGDVMKNKKYLNLEVSEEIENKLENVREHLNLENNEIAAKLAISVLSDLIEEQKNGDEIIVRHKRDAKFWGKKKQYRIEFPKKEALVQ